MGALVADTHTILWYMLEPGWLSSWMEGKGHVMMGTSEETFSRLHTGIAMGLWEHLYGFVV